MVTGGLLAMRLGQIRRRLRLFAAVEGSIGGAVLAMLALAAGVALARGRGVAPRAEVIAGSILLGAAAGALVRAARAIPLARCARLADAALDGQDRLLSALYLDTDQPSPFARALVSDAVRRAAILVPKAVVPARRPAGLPALAMATLALAAAAMFPASSRAARVVPAAPKADRRAPLPAGALDAEREVARAAAETAARLGDARLQALAADFDRALRQLASGTLNEPAALDLLRALEGRATEAARAASRDAQAAAAAARALEASAETRPAGEALAKTAGDAADGERASAALGASAAAHPAETARALASAAATLASPAGDLGDGADAKDGRRRLSRDDSTAGAAPPQTARDPGDPEARHLEKLRRDLDDAASACREGDPACRRRAEDRGRELAQLGRQGAARDALQRLQRSAEQLRARVGRGDLAGGDAKAMRNFGRAANGRAPNGGAANADAANGGAANAGAANGRAPNGGAANGGAANAGAANGGAASGRAASGRAVNAKAAPGGSPGDETAGVEAAEGDGEGTPSSREGAASDGDDTRDDTNGAETAAASAAMAAEGGASQNQARSGNGNGIGHQPGGAPLGAGRPDANGTAGSETDVRLADGAGPGRAEVIGTAAGRGFASPGYARAFNDYAAAVEDALGATGVPEGKRYLVRRYFDLIRPRPPARAPGSPR